jgi:hypothetical protein
VASKFPLAFLVQWLWQAAAFDDHGEHMESIAIISKADRDAAREWLVSEQNALRLRQYEAEWNGIGIDEVVEPDVV